MLLSCNDNNKIDADEVKIVYNESEYEKLWMKNKNVQVKIIDTFCINQTIRAKNDIKKDKITFFCSSVWYEYNEMKELLQKFKIEIAEYDGSCIRLATFKPDCYQNIMHEEIAITYGENFIDSLWQIAEEKFVRKYPDSVYIKDGKDVRLKYLTFK